MNTTEQIKHKHLGRNVKRLREIMGIKQEALALDLGINQQRMSAIEQKEELDDELMERIAEILKVPKQAIENFDEEKVIYNVSCTFSDNAVNNNAINIQNINPVDKWLEAMNKNEELYEKLLQAEKDKNALLKQLLDQSHRLIH